MRVDLSHCLRMACSRLLARLVIGICAGSLVSGYQLSKFAKILGRFRDPIFKEFWIPKLNFVEGGWARARFKSLCSSILESKPENKAIVYKVLQKQTLGIDRFGILDLRDDF